MQFVEYCLTMSLIKFELQTSLVGRDCSYWNTATAIKKTRVRTSSVLLKPPLFGLLFTSKAKISSLFLLMGDGLFLQMSYLAVWEIWTRIAGNKAGRVDHSTTAANCCLFHLVFFCRSALLKKWYLVIFFLSLWSFSSCSVSNNTATLLSFAHQLKPKVCGKLLKVISKSCKKQKLNLETLTLVAILYRCQRFNLAELYEKVKDLVKYQLTLTQ